MQRSHFVIAGGKFPAGMRATTAGEKITNETTCEQPDLVLAIDRGGNSS